MSSDRPYIGGEDVLPRKTGQARQRLLLLSAGVLLLAIAAQALLPLHTPRVGVSGWFWFAFITVGFAFSVAGEIPLRIGRGTYALSVSEVPLIAGLTLLGPTALIATRLLGSLPVLTLYHRQSLDKLAFNFVFFWLEAVVASALWRLLLGDATILTPRGWLAVVGTCILTSLLGALLVSVAIYIVERRVDLRASVLDLASDVLTAVANASFVLVGAFVLDADPRAAWTLVGLGATVLFAYRAHASLQRRSDSLEQVADFSRTVGNELHAEAVGVAVLTEVRQLLRADVAELVLTPADGDVLRLVVREDQPVAVHRTVSGALAGTLVSPNWDGNPVMVSRSARDAVARERLRAARLKDAVVVPLKDDSGLTGTLLVADRVGDVGTFDEHDRTLLVALANHASVALRNGHLADLLRQEADEKEHQSLHDALTGLPNRTLFQTHLSSLIAQGRPVAVLLMDLDRFKEVNDTLGHHTGDQLLIEVARRMRGVLPPTGIVARLGGDEFVICMPDLDPKAAGSLAGDVRGALRLPVPIDDHAVAVDDLAVEVEASIGIAVAPEHGDDAALLLQRADVAMYVAKAAHSGFEVYEATLDQYTPRRLALVSDLRHAIEHGELVNHYQPKVELDGGGVLGVEALVRWQHPRLGLIPPDEFIPVAEQTGLIRDLTLAVLCDALTECVRWRAGGLPLRVAVNLSVRSLHDRSLTKAIRDLLHEHRLPPDALTLEITESSVMVDPPHTITVLRELAEIGVQLSVDDFGTGYSSLAYLKQLPVDEIKIDRSFVAGVLEDTDDVAIIRAVIDLSHHLGKRVVAEGVEDRRAYDRLADLRCDTAQGYWMSRPVPADAVEAWVRQWTATRQSGTERTPPAESGLSRR